MLQQPYHKYVFDIKRRKFVGAFEEMYVSEDTENFDSWFQEDITHLGRQIALLLISRYSFRTILDIGCGKGTFTNLLKKKNSKVLGVDISETAVKKARDRYRGVEFRQATADEALMRRGRSDLIVIIEVLSYLKNWKSFLAKASRKADYLFISLYLPSNPIGYVKNFKDFRKEMLRHFTIEEELLWNNEDMLLMAKSKSAGK